MCHFVSWFERRASKLKGEPTILFVTDVELSAHPELTNREWMDRCGHGFAKEIFSNQIKAADRTQRQYYQAEKDLEYCSPDAIPAVVKDAILKGKMTKVGMVMGMLNPAARKKYRCAIKESKKACDKAERTLGHYGSMDEKRKHYEFCLKTFWKLFKKNSNKSAAWLKAATTK